MNFFDILLAKKLEDKRDPQVKGLTVTQNGSYSESGTVYNVVNVNLPLDEKNITANGTYNASADNLQGYNKVVVNIEGFKLKAMPTGAIATITDAEALPLNDLKISVEPVQAGSGDPSPQNERPISGWTECEVTVKDDLTTPTETKTYNIEFKDGDNPLIVYGATVDPINGALTVKKAYVNMGSLIWSYSVADARFYNNTLDYKRPASASEVANAICSQYKVTKLDQFNDGMICLYTNGYVYVKDSRYTNASDFQTAMDGVQLVYELATPIIYQLDKTSIRLLQGLNNIFADTGDILEGEYFVDL